MVHLVFLNNNFKEKVSLSIVFGRMKAELMFIFFLSLYIGELVINCYKSAK